MTETTSALAAVLREVAAFVEGLDIDIPESLVSGSIGLHGLSKDDLAALARASRKITKHVSSDGSTFWLERGFGLDVRLNAFARSRAEVCRRVVVGTEDVPERVTPAHTRELVEWECDPLLAPETGAVS